MRKTALLVLVLLGSLAFAPQARAITTAGPDPDAAMYRDAGGRAFDGVARLTLTFGSSTFGCSGSLLSTGLHVLTAGHCVASAFGAPTPDASSVRFITESGATDIAGVAYRVNPTWDGGLLSGTDLAIITLTAPAPADATRYDIYRNPDEAGQVGTLAGFGIAGSGATGPTLGFGTQRHGMNRIDALGSYFSVSDGIFLWDFDNGLAANDAFGTVGLPDLGLGLDEVDIAPGDSGGPTFLAGKVAGVHSFIGTFTDSSGNPLCPPDVLTPGNLRGAAGCKLDSSFGEFAADTRVSSFQAFIDAALVPEPGTLLLMLSGLAGLLAFRRR